MKKSAVVILFAALFTIPAFAQSVEDGINHFYAQRYQSAKSVFEKLVAANPNNQEAVYWLGQTYLDMDDVPAARSVYEKALAANANAALVAVGMGHVELMEGKAAEAKQRFENAISTSKIKRNEDPNILNAVGRANVDAYTEKNKRGDLNYAIEKLNSAAKLAPKNASIFLNLGDVYRKIHDGGLAHTNYTKATQLNPAFAQAYYRLAIMYKTQQNWDVVLENLNKAITADPKFAPAYYELYFYYLNTNRDLTKAEDYANKFVSSADPSVENDYLKASTAYVQKKYDDAINICKNIVATAGDKVNPQVFRLLGYSYVEKGDSATACQYVGRFFAKAKEENVVGNDYILQADACGKNNPSIVMESYKKAVMMDSVLATQLKILDEGARHFNAAGQKSFEADLKLLSYELRQQANVKPNPIELIHIAIPYAQSGNFMKADSICKMYSSQSPDSVWGYLWSARSLVQVDTSMTQGLAVPAYESLLKVSFNDKERFKNYGLEAASYLAQYYYNVKNNKESGINYLKKALEFDPTNADIQKNLSILSRPATTRPQAPPHKSPAPR